MAEFDKYEWLSFQDNIATSLQNFELKIPYTYIVFKSQKS